MPPRALPLTALLIFASIGLDRTALASGESAEPEPPTPAQLAVRVALPAIGVALPFGGGHFGEPGAMLTWPLQYALDDLLLPRVRVIVEPQVVYPSPETFPLRLRAGIRVVPRLRGLVDESARFFLGAGVTASSRVALSSEIGWRIPFEWPLWTFFVALRGDYRLTGEERWEADLLGGFTIF